MSFHLLVIDVSILATAWLFAAASTLSRKRGTLKGWITREVEEAREQRIRREIDQGLALIHFWQAVNIASRASWDATDWFACRLCTFGGS